jgi:hypothetical protein
MFADRIYISPNYTPEDYITLRLGINSSNKDWEKAIDIFSDRVYGRYLNAIDMLLEKTQNFPENNIDFSFSSMALMCLLIETLHQFYNGVDETEWRRHEEAFMNFLTGSERFRHHFREREARLFYRHIRNGIIHQAQTKRNTQLCVTTDLMVDIVPHGIRINVLLFYEALVNEVDDYIDKLRNQNEYTIRDNFISKMNYLVR